VRTLALTAFLTLAVIANATAQAAPSRTQFLILSEGASTCGEFIAEPAKQGVRMQWVLGYISGANSKESGPGRMVGSSFEKPATAIGWLQSYCATHSLDILAAAAEAFRKDLQIHESK